MTTEEVSTPVTASIKSLHGAISDLLPAGGKLKKLAGLALAGAALHEVGKSAWDLAKTKTSWSITVKSEDDIYHELHAWLLEQIPEHKRRALMAASVRRYGVVEVGSAADRGKVKFFFDSSTPQTVTLDGHPVRVVVEKEENGLKTQGESSPSWTKAKEKIVFTARSGAGREAIIKFLESVSGEVHREDRTPRLYIANRWGDWTSRNLSSRSVDSVILAEGQMDEILSSIDKFLSQGERYHKLGIPWHHGVLLWGPPGTGKSSLAKALATHFGLDVHIMSLNDVSGDSDLMGLVNSISPRSILLIEDLDKMSKASLEDQTGTESGEHITTSGLRNALDGLATPEGLIVIMSSNDKDSLDGPLVRPGRVDLECEIGYVDTDQLLGLWGIAFGYPSAALVSLAAIVEPRHEITPAMVIGAIKPFLDDEGRADAALVEFLQSTLTAANQRGIVLV